jgi:hypothetical protein
VSEVKMLSRQGEGGAGCAHSMKVGVFARLLLDAAMSLTKGFQQTLLRVAFAGGGVDLEHGVHGNAAGDLSAFVPTHSISDYGDAAKA